jgi:hypothetical protein
MHQKRGVSDIVSEYWFQLQMKNKKGTLSYRRWYNAPESRMSRHRGYVTRLSNKRIRFSGFSQKFHTISYIIVTKIYLSIHFYLDEIVSSLIRRFLLPA